MNNQVPGILRLYGADDPGELIRFACVLTHGGRTSTGRLDPKTTRFSR